MEIYFSQLGGGEVRAQGPADPESGESSLPDFLLCPHSRADQQHLLLTHIGHTWVVSLESGDTLSCCSTKFLGRKTIIDDQYSLQANFQVIPLQNGSAVTPSCRGLN